MKKIWGATILSICIMFGANAGYGYDGSSHDRGRHAISKNGNHRKSGKLHFKRQKHGRGHMKGSHRHYAAKRRQTS